MNMYEKLQEIRCELQDKNLKKSGKNAFAKYEYFELQDIIPTINKLMKKHKITSEMSYDKEMACLKIINSEKPDEFMSFTCPVEMAILKGCHNTQNLGATITYIRRYLYINAFEIVEYDTLDRIPQDNTKPQPQTTSTKPATQQSTTTQPAPDKNVISEPQRKRLYAIGKSSGWKDEEMLKLIKSFKYEHSKDILRKDYEEICEALESGIPDIPHDEAKQEELLDNIKADSEKNVAKPVITAIEIRCHQLKKELAEVSGSEAIYYALLVDIKDTAEHVNELSAEEQAKFATNLTKEIRVQTRKSPQ